MLRRAPFVMTVFAVCCLLISLANAATLKQFSVETKPTAWRFHFTLSGPAAYKTFTLSHPARLVLDLQKVKKHASLSFWQYTKAPIKSLRSAQYPNKLRIVMDLPQAMAYHTSMMRFSDHAELIVELKKPRAQLSQLKPVGPLTSNSTPPVRNAKPQQALSSASQPRAIASTAPRRHSRDIIVMIDPGHGGKDPGATGRRGHHEKTIVLSIAKKLLPLLQHEPGFKAYLTRSGDYYLTLRQRLAIARKHKADMFISIHADAFRDTSARGASVFALSQRGATSEAARWLAARENQSELMGGVDLSDKSHLLKSVLISLSQNASVKISIQIGGQIIRALSRFAALHHNKVDQAAFVVLKSPDIPSLLVETGFITNPYEEKRLISARYQQRIALALESGIVNYFQQHPPRGTSLASNRVAGQQIRRYVVTRGDSLSYIAQRYQVTVKKIRRLNQLNSNKIRVGQQLLIPIT